jgi:16S rRNA (cytidine1402-2'-O)-methyltransferase
VTPYQFIRTLDDLLKYLDNQEIIIGRELTKKFEEIYRGKIKDALNYFMKKKILGEFVICVKN